MFWIQLPKLVVFKVNQYEMVLRVVIYEEIHLKILKQSALLFRILISATFNFYPTSVDACYR